MSEICGDAARCLIVLPRGAQAPATLLDGLRDRGVPHREVADAPSAMAELALDPCNVMILVEPDRLADSQRLAEAVARYHPAVRLWHYGTSGVREVGAEGPAAPPAPEIRVAPAKLERGWTSNIEPMLDVQSHDLLEPAAAQLHPEDASSHSSVTLTVEELSMLLGEHPGGAEPSAQERSPLADPPHPWRK